MQELVVITRIFSGIEIALESGHWVHSGSPAYYHFIRKLNLTDSLKYKLYFLSPKPIGDNKRKKVIFDNLNTTAKVIPYYCFIFSAKLSICKKIEFFYNKIMQYMTVFFETFYSKYYYIDRDNILLSSLLLSVSRYNIVFTRLLGVTEGLYEHLTVKDNYYSRIIRWTFKNNRSYFICTNDGSYVEETKRKFGGNKFHLLFNGVDKILSPKIKKTYEQQDSKIVITYISRIVEDKGHVEFINSLRGLRDYDNLHVYIVGDGDLKKRCMDLVNKYALDDVVSFTGSLEHTEVMSYLMRTTLFVSLNYHGSFGNGVLEAAQHGVPIVTLSHKGFSSNKYPLLKFINNDEKVEDSLTSFIDKFRNDKILAQNMSNNSIEFSRNYLVSWDERIDYEIVIISSVLNSTNKCTVKKQA